MTQEDIMKRRMHLAIIFAVVMAIGMIVFIGLYIDETRRIQVKYREQFVSCLNHTSDSLDSYINADGDYEFRYRKIISDMSAANSFSFLLENLTEKQKITINELNTILIKYPKQMNDKKRLGAYKKAVDDLAQNLDKGFDEANEIINQIDRMGK